jgi:hypothetical protein
VETPLRDDGRRDLLVLAAGVLSRRQVLGRLPELTPAQAGGLVDLLLDLADRCDAPCPEAIALAHRIVDDDAPQASPLWPREVTDLGDGLRATGPLLSACRP